MSITAAASALRRLPLFERVSLRLLQDLVEYASLERWWDDGDPCSRPRSQSMVHRAGVLRHALRGGTVAERRFEGGWLDTALASSFSLAHAFGGRRGELFDTLVGPGHGDASEALPAAHWLFLAKADRFTESGATRIDVDLASAATLLARALDRTCAELGEQAVVCEIGATGLVLRRWDRGRPGRPVTVPAPGGPPPHRPADASALHELVLAALRTELPAPETAVFHVVCVSASDADALPRWWLERYSPRAFHRLVYLTRSDRALRPPPELLALLLPGAWDPGRRDGPYFSSVVPTVVLPPKLATRPYDALWAPWKADLPTLEVAPDGEDPADATSGSERRTMDQRLRRDLCRIRLDPKDLARCDGDPTIARSLDRWARAVTNRQVGLALSGGGATSAALVPFIEQLERNGVPIDVVAGLSGGAILGLFVATGRLASYHDVRHRLAFAGLMPTAILFSEAVEMCVNVEFRGAHVEDLETRFVPMTVELRTDGPPRACAVVAGTLGEGVRVSGIALGWFSPAERRGTRYVDGGVAMGVPSAILPSFGADIAIACNSIVPPQGRLPNAILPERVAQCLRYLPVTSAVMDRVFDRFGDFWVGFLTMLRETARSGARDADVYYEVSPEETPFFDAFDWCGLDRIRRVAAEGRRWEDELGRCVERWNLLRGPRKG